VLGRQTSSGIRQSLMYAQRVPHVIAEEIFKQLTGEAGPSDGAADRN
jgi:hypothetical protein